MCVFETKPNFVVAAARYVVNKYFANDVSPFPLTITRNINRL